MKKIISFKEISEIIPKISEKKTVLVGGCFDVFHYGHLTFLKNAKKEGDFLIVALESDEFIKKRKVRNSIHNQDQRAEILSSLKFVDLVVKLPLLNSDRGYLKLVMMIKPKIIATTEGDRLIENKRKQAAIVKGSLKIVSNLLQDFSTKKIINLLKLEL